MTSVRVIIVNYNAGHWLATSLQSALNYPNAMISVVDNASSDDSFSQAQQKFSQYKQIDWIQNKKNIGFAPANNIVLNVLTEDYAILLNPDCELSENTIDNMLAQFEAHDTLGLASCRIVNYQGELEPTCKRQFPTPWTALVRLLRLYKCLGAYRSFENMDTGDKPSANQSIEWVQAISGAFMVVRKTALEEVGTLDDGYFMHCEDLDWCKRFFLSAWRVGFVNTTQVCHAKGVSSATRPIRVLWSMHKGMARYFRKFHKQTFFLGKIAVFFAIYTMFVLRSIKQFCGTLLRGKKC